MIYGRFAKEKQDLERAEAICRQVREELGLADVGDDGEFILTALVFDGDQPVGAGQVLFDGPCPEIAQVAVLPAYRGTGYGEFLVRMLVEKAASANAREVTLAARGGTEDFFARIGFAPEGEPYERGGARWQPMRLPGADHRICEGCGRIGDSAV